MASIGSVLNTVAGPSSSSTASTAPSSSPSASSSNSTDALANESTFLQLLVAQIKNQDPTQPMDSTAFLSQLAQFSQLEQLVGIRQDVEKFSSTATTTPASSPAAATPSSLASAATQAISSTAPTPPALTSGN
jgi:flagellar basal-body rod modification protein FlgD